MTREEAIVYWETFLSEIDQMEVDDCWTNEEAETQREATKMAISALRAQQEQEKKNLWISVKDRLPDRTVPPHDVLVYHDLHCGMYIDRAWYSHEQNKWRNVLGMNLKVTHWIPLPEPPEDSANG